MLNGYPPSPQVVRPPIPGLEIIPVPAPGAWVAHLGGPSHIQPHLPVTIDDIEVSVLTDFSEIIGQEHVKHAMEVAAAGWHNCPMVRTPRAGSLLPQGNVPRVAVEAYANGVLLGGMTFAIVVPTYAPFDGKLRVYVPEVGR